MFLSALDLCLVLVEWTLHHRASSLICPDHPSPTFTPLAPLFESGDVASMISIAALDFSSTRPDFSIHCAFTVQIYVCWREPKSVTADAVEGGESLGHS